MHWTGKLWWVLGLLIWTSCSNTKYLPEGETLYVGTKVTIQDKHAPKNVRKMLEDDLTKAVVPKRNRKFLGMRIKLSIYNLAGPESKSSTFRNRIREAGEPPVLTSQLRKEKSEALLANILENKGFFYPTVTSTTVTKRKKTKGYFEILTGPQYTVRNIYFPSDTSKIAQDISLTAKNTLLKEGQPFNLDLIKGERDRISRDLTERGYYYFKSDYILVKTDTSIGNHQVDFYLTIKEDMPISASRIYRIGKIFINPSIRMGRVRQDSTEYTKYYEGYYITDRRNTFRPFIFKHAMQFQPGELYNRTEQNRSLNRLVSLGVFKFVKNKFEPLENRDSALLNVYYELTPYPKKSLRIETGVESQSDSRIAALTSVSWRNRNALKGAELFAITVKGGYEAQAGGSVQRPGAFEGGVQASLSIPRFLVPFMDIKPSNMFVPRTIIQVGYDLSMRYKLYNIHSFKASYGYNFKEDIRKEHQLFPINITYVKTDTLSTGQAEQVNFSNILFTGLIMGPSYEYTFNSQAAGLKPDNYYLNALVDFSNNILGLVQGASKEHPKRILGTRYAQYLKFQVDGRYYKHFGLHENNIWVTRLLFGYGHPYGNSERLPNIKQFFSGGASSLRGFRSRMVGPGTFNEEYLYGTNEYIEILGDVKLELNTELRLNIVDFLNAAAFVDAGNIWTNGEDPRFPGGAFSSSFYKELAIDAGLGIRLDFKIILLRFDFAMPIRKPWLPENSRWVFNQIDFSNRQWRRENLIFNLAIGYPF